MSSYWANFIKTGDPNGARLPGWPHYGIGEKQIILLGDQVEATPLPDAEALDFMQSLLGQPIPAASR